MRHCVIVYGNDMCETRTLDDTERSMNQLEAETIATQELEPSEKLLWVGPMNEGNDSKIRMTLVFLPLCTSVFFWNHYSHSEIFFTVVFLVWLFMLAIRIKAVQAITDRRLIVIKPGKSIFWFSLNDVKNIETRKVHSLIFQFSKLIIPTARRLSGKGRDPFDEVPAIDFTVNGLQEPETIKRSVLNSLQLDQRQSAETPGSIELKIKAATIGTLWWSCFMGLAIGIVISLYQILVADLPTLMRIFS